MTNERGRLVAAVVLVLGLSACQGEEAQGIRLPLSAPSASGGVYELRDAQFQIVGPRTLLVDADEASGSTLSVGLPPGDYQVSLLEGWSLVRLPEGVELIATLASANPQPVTVTEGARAPVTFVFDVAGEQVVLSGEGDIDIGFEVREDAGSPDPEPEGPCIDGTVDTCGVSDVGACTLGIEVCFAGAFGGCDAVLPTAETCNSVDDDCDGAIDEGTSLDLDADGFGTCGAGLLDCDDTDLSIHPGAIEQCDGEDDDCDAAVDEGC